jgi:prepilin-type N-terminal cleavage/methylation domain-containing protein
MGGLTATSCKGATMLRPNSATPATHRLAAKGFSLVEMMIVIAILALLSAIAIPLYNSYIFEGHVTAMRTTLSGLRTIMEDYRLENGSYGTAGTQYVGLANIDAEYGWQPSGDSSAYSYTVSVQTGSYDVWGIFTGNNDIWVRCDDRLSNCCDPDTPGASAVTSACP